MFNKCYCVALLCLLVCHQVPADVHDKNVKKPTVLIAILARNKAHTLPYFLSLLQQLDYPKDRLSLWIRSDHNSDNTIDVINEWIDTVQDEYHTINVVLDEDSGKAYPDERGSSHWPPSRFENIMSLRESALEYARNIWADYILFMDCDVFLTDKNTLEKLILKSLPVVAPMLRSDGLYSNFWYGMTDDYYYLRTEDYKPVVNRERLGCFDVPMVHTCVLVDLRLEKSDHLTFVPEKVPYYDGPRDDIITFALSANKSGVPLHVCNEDLYGFVTAPLEQDDPLSHDLWQLTNVKLEVMVDHEPLPVVPALNKFVRFPAKDKLGFDKVYMINLRRRPERRVRMQACFDEMGMDVETLDAVDGRALNESILEAIQFLPGYVDPYHKRPMTFGEIGCFLSHYEIWNRVIDNHYDKVLVLEDDIRFEPFFRAKVQRLVGELNLLNHWDLVYLGRKRLQDAEEQWVDGSRMLVHAGYSYWTLGYALSHSGAQKLLEARPLENMLPVDEYLPILFDKHPQTAWKGHFPRRNLIALSTAPLLLYPTHYTGEHGYISDTEDSSLVSDQLESIPSRDDL